MFLAFKRTGVKSFTLSGIIPVSGRGDIRHKKSLIKNLPVIFPKIKKQKLE